jgi:uncharacterized protein (DUF58 family)
VRPERWLPFLGGIFLLGALLQLPFLTTLSAALAVLISLTSWYRNHALDQVSYRRRPFYQRGFPGEELPLQIEVENRKFLPLSWLRVEDPWPYVVGPEDEALLAPSHVPDRGMFINVYSLRWYERSRRRFNLILRKRGVHRVGPARMRSGDLFGLYEIDRAAGPAEYLTVFPDLLPLGELDLPADDPFGDRRSRRRIFEDPNRPMGVRDYLPEDSFRSIHWPATARMGSLQVKVYQPASTQSVVVCLNIATFTRHWEGYYPDMLERLVSMAATFINLGVQDGYQVGLISNGSLAHSDRPFRIPPSRNPNQLALLLETLAGVTPLVTAPFERYLMQQMPKVHYGSNLIVITALTSLELMEALQQLRRKGRSITLVSLAKEEPEAIPGLTTVHLPFESQAPRPEAV